MLLPGAFLPIIISLVIEAFSSFYVLRIFVCVAKVPFRCGSAMAGVGEASAIAGLITIAAQLSQAVIDIAGRYKNAKAQIESFGHEVGILGDILDQFHRLLSKSEPRIDGSVHSVTVRIVNQCTNLFSELDVYRDSLYSRPGSVRNLAFNGKGRWVFQSSELRYLRARVDSMKVNMLLMMTLESCSNSRRYAGLLGR